MINKKILNFMLKFVTTKTVEDVEDFLEHLKKLSFLGNQMLDKN